MTIFGIRRRTWTLALFWTVLVLCGVFATVNIRLALSERGQPWAGFSVDEFGDVMKAHDTDLVFFDTIQAVNGQLLRSHVKIGMKLREIIRQTPVGTPLTYHVQRGQVEHTVTVPVQRMTWKQLTVEAGFPIVIALGQLLMGAIVFLLRPNMHKSWVFLGFCLAWFGLFVTIYDFSSTYACSRFFLLCWHLTSATLLHLACVFPEERQIIHRSPRLQYLFYVPSLALWGCARLYYDILPIAHPSHTVGVYLTYIHTVYWLAAFLFLLASLIYTATRASSPVARRQAVTVFIGFAAGFSIPVVSESAALLFHVKAPTECTWLLTLLLPLSVTYAILRYNLFDARAIIRRTLTYGILSGVVIVAYLLIISISNKFLTDLPLSQTRGFPVLFGLSVLLVFNPLRDRLQGGLDRVFFRTRYDFRQTIEGLSQDLTALLNLDEIAQRIINTVMGALNVSSAALYLDNGAGAYYAQEVAGDPTGHLARLQPTRDNPIVELIAQQRRGVSRYDLEANPALARQASEAAATFGHLGLSLALPILFQEELIGMLGLGEKKSGAVFTEMDLKLLRTLTNQSAIAIANARSYRSLEMTNAELRSALGKVEILENVKTHLSKFVPTSVQQIIERDPTAPALDKHDQDVTVLFLDIAGYTSMSETLDQDKVNYVVERYFSSFLGDIYANRGDINETAGDGLMIIFQDDDARAHAGAAVRTALAIRDKTQRINAELEGAYAPVTVNMGLNSGPASVGSTKFESTIGTRWTFTASGPVTNLAARLGSYATEGGIYVGRETARRLSEAFVLRDMGPQAFKNVREPVVIYEVLGQQTPAELVSA